MLQGQHCIIVCVYYASTLLYWQHQAEHVSQKGFDNQTLIFRVSTKAMDAHTAAVDILSQVCDICVYVTEASPSVHPSSLRCHPYCAALPEYVASASDICAYLCQVAA